MMTYCSSNLFGTQNYAFKKSELLEILQSIDSNFSFDKPLKEDNPTSYKDFFYSYDVFNGFEVACLISGYDPNQLTISQTRSAAWRNENPKFVQAIGLVLSADKENGLFKYDQDSNSYECDYTISNTDLKKYLISKNIMVTGFNDGFYQPINSIGNPSVGYASLEHYKQQRDRLLEENEKLKAELLETDQKIKELELIQTTVDESKLGNTRAENNVTKLLLVLAKMADIDVSKPHAIHESLLVQAELLGVDKFPSDETIKKWLVKANKHKNSQNPS